MSRSWSRADSHQIQLEPARKIHIISDLDIGKNFPNIDKSLFTVKIVDFLEVHNDQSLLEGIKALDRILKTHS